MMLASVMPNHPGRGEPLKAGVATGMVPLGQTMANTGMQTGGGTPATASPMGTPTAAPPSMAGMPSWVDPAAAAADPAGFAQWQQGFAAQQAPAASPFAVQGANMTSFGPGNDLRSTAIMPGQSPTLNQYDQYVQGQAANVAGQSFSPFQSMGPVNYGTETGMLNGANGAMQGLSLNYGGANGAYGNAVTAQQNAQGTASGMLMGLGGGSVGGGGAQANTARFNSELDTALSGLQGPDRGALAADTLRLLEERTQPGFEASQRQLSQRTAALGRAGGGMYNTELADLGTARERMLDQSRRELATDAAGRTLSDRLDISNFQRGVAGDRFGGETFNASLADAGAARSQQGAMFDANMRRSVAGDLYGMGQDGATLQMGLGDRFSGQEESRVGLGERAAGFQRGIANDLGNFTRDTYQSGVSERDAARDDEFGRAGFGLQSLGALAGVQNQQRGYEGGLRDEARGERGFQNDQARTAQRDAIEQQQFNEWMRNSQWQRTMGAGGLGYGNDPSSALFGAGQNAQGQAGDMYGMLGGLAQGLFSQRRSGAGAG